MITQINGPLSLPIFLIINRSIIYQDKSGQPQLIPNLKLNVADPIYPIVISKLLIKHKQLAYWLDFTTIFTYFCVIIIILYIMNSLYSFVNSIFPDGMSHLAVNGCMFKRVCDHWELVIDDFKLNGLSLDVHTDDFFF